MFLDASAVVAILLSEDDSPAFQKAMEHSRGKLRYSPMTRIEATLALVRERVKYRGKGPAQPNDFEEAASYVDEFLEAVGAHEMHITSIMGKEAIQALSKFGKLAGHPAQLNMGDALSYACAKAYHVPLLYKGKDFSETDLA